MGAVHSRHALGEPFFIGKPGVFPGVSVTLNRPLLPSVRPFGVTIPGNKTPCYPAMGILVRPRKDGTVGYTAVIRIKRGGKVIHTETETFDREPAAAAWMKKRQASLAKPGALDAMKKAVDPTLAEVIEQYNLEKLKEHGKTKTQVLRTIAASDLAKKRCSEISSPDLVSFAKEIAALPQTRGNYMSHLASIFTVARPAWGYPLDPQAIKDARVVLHKMGLVSRSKERHKRPTLAELDRLLTHYQAAELKRPTMLPMTRIILFAIFSTRRQEEITRITGRDLDRQHLEIIVRDMKNPGEKIGNDVRTTLTPEALKLIELQPKTEDRIWPYNADSISTSFTRACTFLGIEDLHFHDLRHDGISRLFEMGWSIPNVATVSGHRSWQSLKRYTHIRQAGDKYAGWKWMTQLVG